MGIKSAKKYHFAGCFTEVNPGFRTLFFKKEKETCFTVTDDLLLCRSKTYHQTAGEMFELNDKKKKKTSSKRSLQIYY